MGFILFSILILMLAGSRVCKQLVNTLIDSTLMLLASPLNWKERTGLPTIQRASEFPTLSSLKMHAGQEGFSSLFHAQRFNVEPTFL